MLRKLSLLCLLVTSISYGQLKKATIHKTEIHTIPQLHEPISNLDKCSAKNQNDLLFQDPVMEQARLQAKQTTRQLEAQIHNAGSANRGTVYRIPVVFHVIHKGEAVGSGTNVSDAQLMSAIDALNRDYRRTSADGGIAQGAGPDTEIEFCLASKDPAGNPHSGINRVDGTTVTDYASQGIISSNEVAVKALSKWDNRYYLNVWVVTEINDNHADTANLNNFTGGTIGYAYYPVSPVTANASRDGIVILNCSVGNDPTNTLGYRLWFATRTNRAFTHEVGHFLDLIHTFENTASCSSETNCNTQGDELCDTPPTILGNTCSTPACTGAIVENYMDYTSETCQDMFTANQTTRMRAALAGVRNELVTTNNCTPPALTADFIANITTVSAGGSVSFTDLTTGGTPTSWSWTFGGGGTPNTSSAQNPTIVFNTPGTYDVQLIVSDGSTSDTMFKTNYIVVSTFNPLTCDTMSNFTATDTLTAYGLGPGTWGGYPGHNSYGMQAYAEPFTVTAATEVQKVILPIFQADAGLPSSSIDIVVYDNNTSQPGTVLGTHTHLINDLSAGFYNIITLDNPIPVSGTFWVGVRLNYVAGDTVLIGTAQHRPSGPSTTYIYTGSSWVSTQAGFSNTLLTSLDLSVLTSGSPAISFSETSLNIATGTTVTFDGSASTGYSSFFWAFNGGTPDTSTNITENVTYNTAGTYDVKLFMLGGCRVDSLVKQIVVSNTTELEKLVLDGVKIYPNPANNELNISLDKVDVGNIHIELIDLNGKLISNRIINTKSNHQITVDLNGIAKGVYQLKLSTETAFKTHRVIKN